MPGTMTAQPIATGVPQGVASATAQPVASIAPQTAGGSASFMPPQQAAMPQTYAGAQPGLAPAAGMPAGGSFVPPVQPGQPGQLPQPGLGSMYMPQTGAPFM